jgi:hypothetical protein
MKCCPILIALAVAPMIALAQPGKDKQPSGKPPEHGQAAGATGKPMEDNAMRDAVSAQERKVWEAIKAQDWTTFEGNLADNFVLITGGGTEDKAQTIDHVKTAHLNDFTLSDWRLGKIDEDAAIIAYKALSTWTSADGKTMTETSYCATTWGKHGGKWTAHSHQETKPGEHTEKEKGPGTPK